MATLGIALIGCGGIALANHLPGFALCPDVRVTALCDRDAAVLERARLASGVAFASTDHRAVLGRDDVDAVVIATPNAAHAPLAFDAIRAGKHVLCEKPIAMDLAEAVRMWQAAESAGVRHMTAFTYRFVPAMAWIAHLVASGAVGRIWHFRAQRFQDWGRRDLGWRQIAAQAGSGELGDMLSHRLDFGHLLVGRLARLTAQVRRFVPVRGAHVNELDDWAGVLGEFASGATGVWESSKLATGRGEGGVSRDWCEVNGDEGTLIYELSRPWEIQRGRAGGSQLRTENVPDAFLKWPGSPRDARAGDPLVTFRYDQDFEFVSAIREQRPCRPSFRDGVAAQAVMDAVLTAGRTRTWVDVPEIALPATAAAARG